MHKSMSLAFLNTTVKYNKFSSKHYEVIYKGRETGTSKYHKIICKGHEIATRKYHNLQGHLFGFLWYILVYFYQNIEKVEWIFT